MSVIGAVVGVRQLVKMGGLPYMLGFSGAALLIGLGAGFYGGHRWQAGKVAEAKLETAAARLDLSNFRGDLATNTAAGWMRANQEAAQARTLIDQWGMRIETQIINGFAQADERARADNTTMRTNLNDPKYACLTAYPYPAGSLLLLQRPGGFATGAAGDGGASTDAPAAASDLPPAAGGATRPD